MGGTCKERRNADQEIKDRLAGAGKPGIARLMVAGVFVGETPYLPTTFRWRYGWPWPRGYTALTDKEWKHIKGNTGL